MPSLISWLDYSDAQRRRMLDVIDLFREPGTRDELGVAAIRDAFAELLFPGTSTIMTRARYYLIVPWIYQRLEQKGVSSADVERRARRLALELVTAIGRSSDKEGNIGGRAGEQLKRLPSSVYWNGLSVWGIRWFRGSQDAYHRALDGWHVAMKRQAARKDERDCEHDDPVLPNWNPSVPRPPGSFPAECTLELEREEAQFLVEQILVHCPGTLLAHLAENDLGNGGAEFAWFHPAVTSFSSAVREQLAHARNFSELMHGAAILYNLILAEQTAGKVAQEDLRESFDGWRSNLRSRSAAFGSWGRDQFWQMACGTFVRVTPRTQEFVNGWWDLSLKNGSPPSADSAKARDLVGVREFQVKGTNARINNPRMLQTWRGASGLGQIEFRWTISASILDELQTARMDQPC